MPENSVTIRAAQPSDAAAIAEVHLIAHRETYGPIFGAGYDAPDLLARRQQWQDWLATEDAVFVAERRAANGVVGFIHASEAHLTSLYILAAEQGRGLGRALLAHLLAALRAQGHRDASFHVLPDNQRAIAFYERLGARRLGLAVDGADGKMQEDLLFSIATDAISLCEISL